MESINTVSNIHSNHSVTTKKPVIADVAKEIESYLAPLSFCDSGDRCGLAVGDENMTVTKILCSLDITPGTLEEAKRKGCNLVVTHHPILFRPLTSVTLSQKSTMPERCVFTAIRDGIACYAAHTSLDSSNLGHNMKMAKDLGLIDITPLQNLDLTKRHNGDNDEVDLKFTGLGLIGKLPKPMNLLEFARKCNSLLKSYSSKLAATPEQRDMMVSTVALCSGSGMSLVNTVLHGHKADVYLTGDADYHRCLDSAWLGLPVIDCGHWGTEKAAVEILASFLKEKGYDVELSEQEEIFMKLD